MRKKVWSMYLVIGLFGCVMCVKTGDDAHGDAHEQVENESEVHGDENAAQEHGDVSSDEASSHASEHEAVPIVPPVETGPAPAAPAAPVAATSQPVAQSAAPSAPAAVPVTPVAQPSAAPAAPVETITPVSPAPAVAPVVSTTTPVVTVTPSPTTVVTPPVTVSAVPATSVQQVPAVVAPAPAPTPVAPTVDASVTAQASKLMTESSRPVDVHEAAHEEPEEKEGGIDSININDASGNWLLKRVWFEKSEDRYDKIKERVTEVESQRQSFFTQRGELETKILTPFYLAIGIDQGTLNVILEDLTQEFNQIKKKTVVLSEQEREFLELIGAEKKSLDQLKDDVALIEKIDVAVDESLDILNDQIKRCHEYEKEAWQYLQDITKELSDKKARTLYYKMDTVARNIANIFQYIKGPFNDYFDQLLSLAKTNTERVKDTMAMLKEKGIDFQKRAQTLKDIAAQRERGVEEKEQAKEIEEQEEEDAEQSEGWFASIGNAAHSVWTSIKQMISSVYETISGWFTSKKEEPIKNDESAPVKEAVVEEKIVEEKPSAVPDSAPEVLVKSETPVVAEVTPPISEAPTKGESALQTTETPSPFQMPITIPAVSEPAAAPPVPAEVPSAPAEIAKEESPEVKTEEPAAAPTP